MWNAISVFVAVALISGLLLCGCNGEDGSGAALKIATCSLLDGVVDVGCNATLEATGGTPPYIWDISDGSLPDGLSLDAGTGKIFGMPTTEGNYTFTIYVTGSKSKTAQKDFIVEIFPSGSFIIATRSLPDGMTEVAYSATLEATGGTAPCIWSIIAGNLPDGLFLDSQTGIVSGTPTAEDDFNFTAKVADALSMTATRDLSIAIAAGGGPGPDPPVVMASPPGGDYDYPVDVTLTANKPATIYYTTDGSAPTTSHYTGYGASPLVISITTTTTLKFFAVDEKGNKGAVQTHTYTIG